MNTENRMMTALFRDGNDAERAYKEVLNRGYSQDDISFITSETTRNKYFGEKSSVATADMDNKAMEGTGLGSVIGGTVGAIVGAIAAIGTSIALPGLGLIIAGPIVAALAGAGAGGATGGIVGALVGWGMPEDRAAEYDEAVRNGGTILGFNPRNNADASEVQKIWQSYNGELMHS